MKRKSASGKSRRRFWRVYWGSVWTTPRAQSTETMAPSFRRWTAPAAPTITALPNVRPTVAAWAVGAALLADDSGRLPDIGQEVVGGVGHHQHIPGAELGGHILQ